MTVKWPWLGSPCRASPHIGCWVVKALEKMALVPAAKPLLTVGSNVSGWGQGHFTSFSAGKTKYHVVISYHYYPCLLFILCPWWARVIFSSHVSGPQFTQDSLIQISLNVSDGVWFEVAVSPQISIPPACHSFFLCSVSLELIIMVPWRDLLQLTLFSSHPLSTPCTYPALGLDSCHAFSILPFRALGHP